MSICKELGQDIYCKGDEIWIGHEENCYEEVELSVAMSFKRTLKVRSSKQLSHEMAVAIAEELFDEDKLDVDFVGDSVITDRSID